MSIRVAIETLGCKLNQAESEMLARQFVTAGCQIVGIDDGADVYILNTCTVTHIADRKCRQSLRVAHRRNPNSLIIATGCYINRSADEISAIEGIDLLVSNEDKSHLVDIVSQRISLKASAAGYGERPRTRAFIKAQDGCNRHCAYCIVPLVRGRRKSLSSDEIIAEIKDRVADGFKEVVLTGTEIGSYFSSGLDITRLLERILSETKIERLRISSLQPDEIPAELISLWKNPRLCPHFHISLQSGADSVLDRMRRGYTVSNYGKALRMIRKALPEVAITTDVIVGFPGEMDAEFQETVEFCHRMGFARIHIFSYSARPGTAAADMPGQVDTRIKRERSAKMLALAEESTREFLSRFIGTTFEVLWEQEADVGVWSGYTPNYIRVYTHSKEILTNVLTGTRLIKLYKDGVWGDLSDAEGNE